MKDLKMCFHIERKSSAQVIVGSYGFCGAVVQDGHVGCESKLVSTSD